jgi:hypothetical protein
MKKYLLAILCSLISTTLNNAHADENRDDVYLNLLSHRVAMVAVLANPKSFDGKNVFVDGILHNTFEDDTLYLDREMADALVKTNGLGLHYNESKLKLIPHTDAPRKVDRNYFHNKLCAAFGTFKAKSQTLENVTAVWENTTPRNK